MVAGPPPLPQQTACRPRRGCQPLPTTTAGQCSSSSARLPAPNQTHPGRCGMGVFHSSANRPDWRTGRRARGQPALSTSGGRSSHSPRWYSPSSPSSSQPSPPLGDRRPMYRQGGAFDEGVSSATQAGGLRKERSRHLNTMRLAVLIDGDNAQASVIQGLLAEVAKYGTANVKRIYADWTSTQSRSWKDALLRYSIQPVQQFRYTTGKNATDSALIIDAMDLLHSGSLDGFCIVSSDSDFTRLASRLREDGHFVMGFGEKKTPSSFVHSCDKFVYTEVLRRSRRQQTANNNEYSNEPATSSNGDGISKSQDSDPWPAARMRQDPDLIQTLNTALEEALTEDEDDGWANLGYVSKLTCMIMPDFDCRNYGYSRFSEVLAKLSTEYEMNENKTMVRIRPDPILYMI